MLFAGMSHYPSGGWRDYKGAFPSMEDAVEFVANQSSIDWWHIVSGGEIVKEGGRL